MQQQLEQQQKEHKAKIELQRMQLELQQNKMEQQQNELKAELDAVLKQREKHHKAGLDALLSLVAKKSTEGISLPSFAPFVSTSELWQDNWSRFCTFVAANIIPDEQKAQVF